MQETQTIHMTDEEIIKFYEELVEFYGDKLANFEHYPRQFANQVKLYRYYKGKQNENSNLQ
jgi:hypothetical protein